MKSLIIAATLAVSSAAALAGPAPVKLGEVLVFDDSLANPRTRAEVRAETLAAAERGELRLGEVLKFDDGVSASKSRAEVRADVRQALGTRQLHYGDTAYPNFN